jgi:hypothetical protein
LKKLIAILLLPVYLFSIIGFNVHLHYCGGTLAASSIITKASCDCEDASNGEITEEDGCCKNETSFKKFDTEHALKSVAFPINSDIIKGILKLNYPVIIKKNNDAQVASNKIVFADTGPPRQQKNTKILLLYCALKLCA